MKKSQGVQVIPDVLTVAQVLDLLRALPQTVVPYLAGPPGIGKTDIVGQLARELDADLVVLRASELRPEDIVGLPALSEAGFTSFAPLRELLRLTTSWDESSPRPAVLFLDEMSQASPELFASLQYLLLQRTVGGPGAHPLRDDVRIIAAGNRATDRAYAHVLPSPLISRMLMLTVEPDLDEWTAWARANGVHPRILAFLATRVDCFSDFDPKAEPGAFACPRTWRTLSTVIERLDAARVCDAVRRAAITGTVGAAAGAEYCRFEQYAMTAPSAEEILRDPHGASTCDAEPALALAALENLFAAVRGDAHRYADSGLVYVSRMHREYQTLFATALTQLGTGLPEPVVVRLLTSPEFERLRPVLATLSAVAAAA